LYVTVEKQYMRIVGIVLIVLGVLMFVFNGFNFQTEKRVVDIGPIKVDKAENHNIGWPAYAGGLAIIAGIVVLVTNRKRA
jgi:uncharacterized membrane protein HdeD (DUF308 family)